MADAAGRTLYTYGADTPGDCNYLPLSGCAADCAISWPPFNGGPRLLAPGLDDSAFGTIVRSDGSPQTTYYGWPLYYYKSDTARGMLTGQAKSKTWHAATVIPAEIVIMKIDVLKFLGDEGGRTLYTFSQDTKGTADASPVSACLGACLDAYRPFEKNRILAVSSLAAADFSLFVRADGAQQVAYRGSPLYRAAADLKAGDMNGVSGTEWGVAAP